MDLWAPASHREASLCPCQSSRRILKCPTQLDGNPDVDEQTGALKALPDLTREYTRRSHRNSRKTMRLPPPREMRPDFPHYMQSNSVFPIRHGRSIDFLEETPERPQGHCHKSRWTMKSQQQQERAQCTPNQLEMRPDSPALAPEPSLVPHQIRHVA